MAEVKVWVWSGNAAKLLADNILVGATTVSATELGYLSGVTSAIQTQLNAKEPTINLTINRAVISSGTGGLTVSATTATEVGYLSGVTSAIQTQLNAKLNLSGGTLTGALTIDTASNQLVLSSGVNALTVNGGTSAAARTYTVPDVGTTADFVMTAGTQTIAGAKTLSSALTITPVTNQIVLGTTNTTTINAATPASSAVYTIPDVGTTADFVMTAGTQTIAGAKTFSNLLTLSAGATITGSISLTNTSSKIFTNTSDAADNKRIQIGGGGDAANSRGAYLNIYGNEYAGAGGYLDCIVGNVAGSLFRVIQLGVSTIVSETDSAVANTLYLKAGNVGIGTTNPIQARAVISKDQTDSSAAVFSNSHLRLIHNSVTNTTGVTALTASTGGSATDNYGISIGAQRYGATSAPKFFVRMHNNSDVGIEAITALETGAVTLGPAVQAGVNGVLHVVNTGDQGTTYSIGSANAGKIQFCNAASSTAVPMIAGTSNDTGVGTGLFLQAYTNDGNTLGDMLFDIRENDGTAHATTTNLAYVFRSFTTSIMQATRAGAWTLGPSGGTTQIHRSNGLIATGATAGANGAPPAQVSGYIVWNVNGNDRKIPYYNI